MAGTVMDPPLPLAAVCCRAGLASYLSPGDTTGAKSVLGTLHHLILPFAGPLRAGPVSFCPLSGGDMEQFSDSSTKGHMGGTWEEGGAHAHHHLQDSCLLKRGDKGSSKPSGFQSLWSESESRPGRPAEFSSSTEVQPDL